MLMIIIYQSLGDSDLFWMSSVFAIILCIYKLNVTLSFNLLLRLNKDTACSMKFIVNIFTTSDITADVNIILGNTQQNKRLSIIISCGSRRNTRTKKWTEVHYSRVLLHITRSDLMYV